MLAGFGYQVEREGASASLCGGGEMMATKIDVPADISSATFLWLPQQLPPILISR